MAYKLTFIGDAGKLAQGFRQAHFCPLWPNGLKPGQSVTVEEVPHKHIRGGVGLFLVDGAPYVPPAPETTGTPNGER